jgi:hypothetical protein
MIAPAKRDAPRTNGHSYGEGATRPVALKSLYGSDILIRAMCDRPNRLFAQIEHQRHEDAVPPNTASLARANEIYWLVATPGTV